MTPRAVLIITGAAATVALSLWITPWIDPGPKPAQERPRLTFSEDALSPPSLAPAVSLRPQARPRHLEAPTGKAPSVCPTAPTENPAILAWRQSVGC